MDTLAQQITAGALSSNPHLHRWIEKMAELCKPDAIRWVAYFVPARYFIEIARDAFVRGGGWSAVWTAHVALTLLGVMYLVIAWRKMRQMQLAD